MRGLWGCRLARRWLPFLFNRHLYVLFRQLVLFLRLGLLL
jgi:hypothetical protein